MDPVFQDIQAYETSHLGPRVLFNTPDPMNPHHKRNVEADSHEPLAGQPMRGVIHMTRGRRICVMQCGFHTYVESWGMAVDHPCDMLTAADGKFSLTDGLPGEYTLVAGRPGIGTMLEKKVTVPAKGTVSANFQFESPKGRYSGHEIEENPHFGLEALGEPFDIRSTLEKQNP